MLLLPAPEHRAGIPTTRTAARTACAGCGSALAPAVEWCWLCHRAVREPVRADVGTPGDVRTSDHVGSSGPIGAAGEQDRATAPPHWWRTDLRPRVALALAAGIVAVLAPLLTLVLALLPTEDAGSGGTTGLLGGSDRVDVSELDRPAGP